VPADIAEAALHIAEGEAQEMRHSPGLEDTAEFEGIAEAGHCIVVPVKLHNQLVLLDTAGVEDTAGIDLAADTDPAVGRGSEEDIDLGVGTVQLADRMDPHKGVGLRTEAGKTLCLVGMMLVINQPAERIAGRIE
jgi:hypothetical protein